MNIQKINDNESETGKTPNHMRSREISIVEYNEKLNRKEDTALNSPMVLGP